ncbi:MAG: hypothetical protein J6Y68_04635 [Clostridia bacterium]|nr:hypothetical protein [Clostridia bacterium]MBP5648493.1 hypothetical protein [Clostridia bacterium]
MKNNKKQYPRNEQDSLKKSHSKLSNAKLSLLCLLASVMLAVLVIGLGLLVKGFEVFPLIMVIVGGVMTVGCIFLFFSFKR